MDRFACHTHESVRSEKYKRNDEIDEHPGSLEFEILADELQARNQQKGSAEGDEEGVFGSLHADSLENGVGGEENGKGDCEGGEGTLNDE